MSSMTTEIESGISSMTINNENTFRNISVKFDDNADIDAVNWKPDTPANGPPTPNPTIIYRADMVNFEKLDLEENVKDYHDDTTQSKIKSKEFMEFCDDSSGLLEGTVSNLNNDKWLEKVIKMTRSEGVSEMYLQQFIYNCFANIFNFFSLDVSDLFQYKADQKISIHRNYSVEGYDSDDFTFDKSPDAAIALYEAYYSIGTMEIKAGKNSQDRKRDRSTSVLLSVLSALFMRNELKITAQINIPFIIGNAAGMTLYVLSLKQGSTKPQVQEVLQKGLTAKSLRMMTTRLAYLLKQLKNSLHEDDQFEEKCRDSLCENYVENGSINGATWTKSKKADKSGGKDAPKNNKKKNDQSSGAASQNASLKERLAMEAVTQSGKIMNVKHPFYRALNAATYSHGKKWKYFQQSSPYFFSGKKVLQPTSSTSSTEVDHTSKMRDISDDVFFKVWNEMDEEDASSVKNEMQILKEANLKNVPSPTLIEELCSLNAQDSTSQTYQVMAMQQMTRNVVFEDDLLVYAKSLIQSCQKLHDAGILHCDIKPDNIAWDRKNQLVSLLDFGHSQHTKDSKSYRTTEGFEAPEIINSEPHSIKSDAYSVGKTLLFILDMIQDEGGANQEDEPVQSSTNSKDVRKIANALCMEDCKYRLGFEQAISDLEYHLVSARDNVVDERIEISLDPTT